MPASPLLEIDAVRASKLWSEVDRTLYNTLPIYLAKTQVEYVKLYDRWGKLLKPWRWTPNQGYTARGVRKERSPILRSQAIPNPITQMPNKDVIGVRELREDAQLYRKDFESSVFQFLPSFADFLTNHVDYTMEDIQEKIMVYKDLFYRTAIFHGSPAIYICGAAQGIQGAPYWTSPTIALSKTVNYLQSVVNLTTGMLTLEHLKKLGTICYNDLAMTPFQNDVLPDGSNGKQLQQKYALVCGSEVWDSFTDTGSFLLANKALDLDIVTGPFTGSLFGRWTTMMERFELRIAADGTIPAPETFEANESAYNYGETIMNPAYVSAPYGVAFAVGAEAYKAITIGPPPGMFGSGSLSMDKFAGMDWNGKVHMTRNLLVPSLDENSATVLDTNKRGEYLQLLAEIVLGIMPIRRRNILPIVYLRSRIET